MYPSVPDVLAFLGHTGGGWDEAGLTAHLNTAATMVRGYTRGAGFDEDEPNDELAAVIVSCAARLHSNPTGNRQMTSGPFAVTPGTFNGWTLAELAVLNNYRRRAM